MANLIYEAKNEILKEKMRGDCCTLAFCYAIVQSGGSLKLEGKNVYIEISTSCKGLFEKINEIIENLYGGFVELKIDEDSLLNHTTFLIDIPVEFSNLLLSDLQMFANGKYDFSFNEHIVENECCLISFLKGVFLTCATSSILIGEEKNKAQGYHLEYAFQNDDFADVISNILAQFGIIERTVYRGNSAVVYLSDYDSILTLIGVLGANKTYLNLENENVSRSIAKDVNRQMNFAYANLNKQSEVSAKQVLAIKEIDAIIGLASLPFELFELAKARIANPELSLDGLKEKLSKPISKSGINHRMRKLMAIYNNLKN